jgi:hypothetical protein
LKRGVLLVIGDTGLGKLPLCSTGSSSSIIELMILTPMAIRTTMPMPTTMADSMGLMLHRLS